MLGRLPVSLMPDDRAFDALWRLHPPVPPVIHLHGRRVALPRWQEAYGRDYHFSGQRRVAQPLPRPLRPFLDWARDAVDPRLNGLLLNWYDGALGHYIGRHRDSRREMIEGTPIVTLSFGEARVMRFRRWKGTDRVDIDLPHGSVLVLPYAVNLAWTHEIVKSARASGRRISVTLRAFT